MLIINITFSDNDEELLFDDINNDLRKTRKTGVKFKKMTPQEASVKLQSSFRGFKVRKKHYIQTQSSKRVKFKFMSKKEQGMARERDTLQVQLN